MTRQAAFAQAFLFLQRQHYNQSGEAYNDIEKFVDIKKEEQND